MARKTRGPTEPAWWAATDPEPLLDWLFFDRRAADRKMRLFAVACARRVEHLVGEPFTELLRQVEARADGARNGKTVDDADLACVIAQRELRISGNLGHLVEAAEAVRSTAIAHDPSDRRKEAYRDREYYEMSGEAPAAFAASVHVTATVELAGGDFAAEWPAQVRILHDLFGPLPFRDATMKRAWLTADVTALARGVYDDRAFDRAPILADALQDAGCDRDEMLAHLRLDGWDHVRGCWAVDLLLGRPAWER